MNELKVFDYEGKGVRTVDVEALMPHDETLIPHLKKAQLRSTWFVLKDVCDVLGIVDSEQEIKRLSYDERYYIVVDQQEIDIINESGLYNVIFHCDNTEAKPFRIWVTNEVLPSIYQERLVSRDENFSLKERQEIANILKYTPVALMPQTALMLKPFIGDFCLDYNYEMVKKETRIQVLMAAYELVCNEKYILKRFGGDQVAIDKEELEKISAKFNMFDSAVLDILVEDRVIQTDPNGRGLTKIYIRNKEKGSTKNRAIFRINRIEDLIKELKTEIVDN